MTHDEFGELLPAKRLGQHGFQRRQIIQKIVRQTHGMTCDDQKRDARQSGGAARRMN